MIQNHDAPNSLQPLPTDAADPRARSLLDVELLVTALDRAPAGQAAQFSRLLSARIQLDHGLLFRALLDASGRTCDISLGRTFADVAENTSFRHLEILGHPFWESPLWRSPQDRSDSVKSAVARALSGEESRFVSEHRSEKGELVRSTFSLVPVRDRRERIPFVLVEGSDAEVPERRREGTRRERIELQTVSIPTHVSSAVDIAPEGCHTQHGAAPNETHPTAPSAAPSSLDAVRANSPSQGNRAGNGAIATSRVFKPRVLLIASEGEGHLRLEGNLREAGIQTSSSFETPDAPDVVLVACDSRSEASEEVSRICRIWKPRGSRVIVATIASGKSIRAAVEAGADDVVALPFDGDECVARIQLNLRTLALRHETERATNRAEENLRLYSEARQAWRVRDEFLSIASHELRTPLTPLAGQFQMLRQFAEDAHAKGLIPKDAMRLFESSGRQLARLNRLVGDLLEVSRAPFARLSVEPKEFDAREMLRSLLEQFAPQAASVDCALELDAPEAQPVFWDRMRMEQVVSNLLSNAFRYAQGKPISLALRGATEATQNMVLLSVKDHGMGIDPADHARIFQRFERAAPSEHFGGFGLGLAITSDIVTAHGGRVSVESARGEGATFLLTLPARFAPPEQDTVGSACSAPPFSGSARPA